MGPRILLAATLAAILPAATGATLCADKCQQLIHQAHALEAKGRYGDALEKFQAAREAAPGASQPLAFAAMLLQHLAKSVPDEAVAEVRAKAGAAANAALALDRDDPIAQDVLRLLEDDGPSPLHLPNPAAAKVLQEAEFHFAHHDFDKALEKYEEAMRLDPRASSAWVGAADCHYFRRDWEKAEPLFRRATEIEPRNAQAWRFLSDALLQQGKLPAAEDALFSAIAADPGQRTNWAKLASLRAGAGLPLRALRLRRGVRVAIGADGKTEVQLDDDLVKGGSQADTNFRIALAIGEAGARSAARDRPASPFAIERDAWTMAIATAAEAGKAPDPAPGDPALRQIQAMAKDGQLEAAILILMFRQAYRPELERWIAANPRGLRQFVDRYGIQP